MKKGSTRRSFLKAVSVGAAMSVTAAARARTTGANERIGIGLIGCGQRGGALARSMRAYAERQGIDVTAVCDPWRVQRAEMLERIGAWYGRRPRQFASYRDLLASSRVDAVIIASCDHQHAAHIKAAAEAGKDIYCEAPLGMDLDEVKAACGAVKRNGVVAQVGTQARGLPGMAGVRRLYQSGALGKVCRIEQTHNAAQPYWKKEVREVRKEDVLWDEFVMGRPMHSFDARQYSAWSGYRDFSAGPVARLGSEFVDLVHYVTGASVPVSAISVGGAYVRDGENKFTCPDHVQAVWTYPEGFMVSYSANFGSEGGSKFTMATERGIVDLLPHSAPRFQKEGQDGMQAVAPVNRPGHLLNWIQAMRDRATPVASIDAGYRQAVAVIMATRALDTGRKQMYDPGSRTIREA